MLDWGEEEGVEGVYETYQIYDEESGSVLIFLSETLAATVPCSLFSSYSEPYKSKVWLSEKCLEEIAICGFIWD